MTIATSDVPVRENVVMLINGALLSRCAIKATDDRIGTVGDLLFDKRTWMVRWLVVETGTWLSERKVLIHPSAILSVDVDQHRIKLSLTRAQVEGSPDISKDEPISRKMESRLYRYYDRPIQLRDGTFGPGAMTGQLSSPPIIGGIKLNDRTDLAAHEGNGDLELRSTQAMTGYHIRASDGEIGHLEDFQIDDATWALRYFVVDTQNWWVGKHVLISPFAVCDINWSNRTVSLNVTREAVRRSPPWDEAKKIHYSFHELHDNYDWLRYGP